MTDIFSADQPQTQDQPAAAPAPAVDINSMFADQLSAITNDDGKPKYANVSEALKGAANAQEYIRKLQRELDEVKEAAQKGSALSDVMDAISKTKQDAAQDQGAKSLGEEDVSAMFQKLLTQAKADEIKSANEAKFSQAVSATYGEKSKEFIKTKAAELGINTDLLRQMAQTSPVAAMQLIGVKGKEQTAQPGIRSSMNTETFQQSTQVPDRKFSMGMSTHNELVSEWNRCKQIVANKF